MTRRSIAVTAVFAVVAAVAAAIAQPAAAQPSAAPSGAGAGIERIYVLYCGDIALNDASSFTPGASGPGALAVSC